MFWNQLREALRKVPEMEKLIGTGDQNGHVGRKRPGYERWHRRETFGQRNDKVESILDTARMYDVMITNTFFGGRRLSAFRS